MSSHFQDNNVSLPFIKDVFNDLGGFSPPREAAAFKPVQDDGQSLSAGTILVVWPRIECRLRIVDNPAPGNSGTPLKHAKTKHDVAYHLEWRILRNSVGSRRNPRRTERVHIFELDAFFDLRTGCIYPEGRRHIFNSRRK